MPIIRENVLVQFNGKTLGISTNMKLPILTRLRTLHNQVQSCNKCDISNVCEYKVTTRIHNPFNYNTLDILFLGEAPGDSEYINHLPFIGPSGDCFNAIVSEALDPYMSYCVSNSLWCTPFTDNTRMSYRTPFTTEVEQCSTNVRNLINLIKPKHFIAVGAIAAKSFKALKIDNFCKIMHPSKIMQSSKYDYEFDNAVLTIKQYLSK